MYEMTFNELPFQVDQKMGSSPLVYRMLKYGEEYVTQSMEEYEAKMKANVLKALERKAAAMGFQLSPLPYDITRSIEAVAVARQVCRYAQR